MTGSTRSPAPRKRSFEQLSDRLQAWLKKYRPQFKDAEPDMPKSFDGRVADKWRILLAIAEHAGGTWPERARRAALALTGEREASDGEVLLGAIRKVFAESKQSRLSSTDLCGGMQSQAILTTQPQLLAQALKAFGIAPTAMRISGKSLRGYDIGQFADAFSRYLGPETEDENE